MSKNSTSKVVRYSRENLPPDKTDWARIDAMTDEEVVAGLTLTHLGSGVCIAAASGGGL